MDKKPGPALTFTRIVSGGARSPPPRGFSKSRVLDFSVSLQGRLCALVGHFFRDYGSIDMKINII